MRRLRATLTTALATLFGVGGAGFSLYEQNDHWLRWPSNEVHYELNQYGSDNLTDGSDLDAVRRAVASWNQISCATVTLVEAGTTTETDTLQTAQTTDGINRVTWIEDNRWEWGSSVLGLTMQVFSLSNGAIQEADIVINGYSNSWRTDGSGAAQDVESVAVHELGHLLGLQHVLNGEYYDPPPTMSPSALPSLQSRSLSPDDQLGACFLYPKGDYLCAQDCDCPAILDSSGSQEQIVDWVPCNQGTCTGRDPAGGGWECIARTGGTTEDTGGQGGAGGAAGSGGAGASNGSGGSHNTGGSGADPNQPCACDTTWGCDQEPNGAQCGCDPECPGGCAATAPLGDRFWILLPGLAFLAARISSGRRRRR